MKVEQNYLVENETPYDYAGFVCKAKCIFDEATSALDYENKLLVYDLIREDFPNLTLIAISHDENEI